MSESILSTRRQLELMLALQQLADQRARAEKTVASAFASDMEAAQQQANTAMEELHQRHTVQRRRLENEFAQTKLDAVSDYQRQIQEAKEHHDQTCHAIDESWNQASTTENNKYQEARWEALAVFDAAKDQPSRHLQEASQRIDALRSQIVGLQRDANTLLAMRHWKRAVSSTASDESATGSQEGQTDSEQAGIGNSPAEPRLQKTIHHLRQGVLDLQSQRLPSLLLEGGRPVGWVLAFFAVSSASAGIGWLVGAVTIMQALAAMILGGALPACAVHLLLVPRARRQTLEQLAAIDAQIHSARALEPLARDQARAACEKEAAAILQQRDLEMAATRACRNQAIAEAEALRKIELERARTDLDLREQEFASAREKILAEAVSRYPPRLEQLANVRRSDDRDVEQQLDRARQQVQQTREEAYRTMSEKWHRGFHQIADQLEAMHGRSARFFPDWRTTDWDRWQRPEEPPEAIRFGSFLLPLASVKNGLSEDRQLHPAVTSLDLPALMTLPEQPRMVLTVRGDGKQVAVQVMHQTILRFLTAMPAGKLRMTLIDAAGLGENFAALMHLADFDEQLVGRCIWTDGRKIDERLSRIQDSLEMILQKYLRNDFATIQQYNLEAGEVAEPFQLLVVANFPAGFSESAAQKLLTIATTGPRCGVYTLISIDDQLRLPNEFDLQTLLTDAVHLQWTSPKHVQQSPAQPKHVRHSHPTGHLVWQYPLFEKLSLECDPLPPADRMGDLLRTLGRQSRQASRVEVPFSLVAPPDGELWTSECGAELVVPIGRAGANQLQSLRLGVGTSQHVLISGKTGSGKSTLLHALVTNTTLFYSPDEVEFYLIDFKKGVEFKAYATAQLPHARVIAIESEREFGVSVLERLDDELRRRGEWFRQLGVQDLNAYRTEIGSGPREKEENGPPQNLTSENGDRLLPRILLVIDEFQELFVADDKLAQDAALLLDRLVRQGRAFGIHVLLGSQTLAGAYSLARSTLGQMAVRVALECSEADAHLILSDDNRAARLLGRPGEAIYNDQGGLVGGNQLFQVVWLPDAERKKYLADVSDRSRAGGHAFPPPIVFEGNVPADPRQNESLCQILETPPDLSVTEPTIWLGSAVRIEPSTHLILRQQGGNHLLVVGSQEPMALGILANCVLALCGQQRSPDSRFVILDGSRPESTQQGMMWKSIAAILPSATRVVGPRETAESINQIADEVQRRCELPDATHAPFYLVIHDLAQFRDLRRTEEDFSFSVSADRRPSPDQRFRDILCEGPTVGVHLLLWADSAGSLNRSIDRIGLREIDYRVALPMSVGDSTSLIETPAAGKLGEHRAIFYRDDRGTQTKFRPYHPPTPEWLEWVGQRL